MLLDEILNREECFCKKEAIICENNSITYEELHRNINRMFTLLTSNNVAQHDRVIIYMDKSIEFIISIFSILSIGATYVPVDNQMPLDRLLYIADNCSCQYIITDSKNVDVVVKTGRKVFLIDDYKNDSVTDKESVVTWNSQLADNACIVNNRSSKDIAYIIYTSGSTGTPKGVMIRHESVVAFVKSINEMIEYSSETRYLNVSPFYFDACIVDIFCTLAVGGTLVIMKKFVLPTKLAETLEKYQISDTLLVSSILKLLASKFVNLKKYDLSRIRTIWYGAEGCPVNVIKEIKKGIPQVKFVHGYGPTEATHTTTMLVFDEVNENQTGFMPIGKPLPNVNVIAINEKNDQIKENEIGMLYVSGLQLFEGYCNDKEKNDKFLFDNFLNSGCRYYKTNDLVTIDKDGNYVYIGRSDDMIKVSGKLVYINEVEAVLLNYKFAKDIIVVAIEDSYFARKMVCFASFKEDRKEELNNLIEYAKQKLQTYMIPSKFLLLDEKDVPRTQNDKVDRRALEERARSMFA